MPSSTPCGRRSARFTEKRRLRLPYGPFQYVSTKASLPLSGIEALVSAFEGLTPTERESITRACGRRRDEFAEGPSPEAQAWAHVYALVGAAAHEANARVARELYEDRQRERIAKNAQYGLDKRGREVPVT